MDGRTTIINIIIIIPVEIQNASDFVFKSSVYGSTAGVKKFKKQLPKFKNNNMIMIRQYNLWRIGTRMNMV